MLKHCQTAIIIAGGKSSRMGFDKTTIPFQNGHLLDYQIKILKQVFPEIILVSNTIKNYPDLQVRVVEDLYKEIGPLAGLHVGLKNSTCKYAFVIACDMPFVDLKLIQAMADQLEGFNQEVLLAEVNGSIEPFHAIYHQSVYEKIERFILNTEHYGLKYFIKSLDFVMLDQGIVDGYENSFINVNTVDDIKKYIK